MHTNPFDRFQEQNSLIHRLDARAKLITTLLIILSNLLLPDGAWISFSLVLVLLIAITSLARLPWFFSILRSWVVLPFALMAVTVLFSIPGETIFEFKIFNWELIITDAGSIRFASILFRSWLSIQAAILLTATTSLVDLGHAMRHLKMPPILVAIIAFMYRYLFVLGDESIRLIRARAARGARKPYAKRPSPLWQARVAGYMVGQLFTRSLNRSERVFSAMQARGFKGRFMTLNPHHFHTTDWIALLIVIILLASLQLFTITYG